jgi:hypothetical protein
MKLGTNAMAATGPTDEHMRTMPMIWNKGKERSANPCAVCGRPLAETGNWAVHVINGGGDVLHPDDENLYLDDRADLGCHMVGPECRKRFGEFSFPW